MPPIRCVTCVVLLPITALVAQTPSTLVVPAAYTTNDANSHEWMGGAATNYRQQTLIGASHLTALVGRTLTAIELRRTVKKIAFQGGRANMTVTMSTSPNTPLTSSPTFAANAGAPAVQVFTGAVTLPTSPPVTGTTVAWSANNVVRIDLQTPFLYLGGTICLDILGQPVVGLNADWWLADATYEDIQGTVTDLGGGCGIYGGPNHQWSTVEENSLVPGGQARFFAYGTPWGFGLAAFGQKSLVGTPLSMFGFNSAPGCNLFLNSVDAIMIEMFAPDSDPLMANQGGRADVLIALPGTPSVLGVTMTTQWLDWMQTATSNAIEWTVAGSLPTLDMAQIEGNPALPYGQLTNNFAPVLRFEYQ